MVVTFHMNNVFRKGRTGISVEWRALYGCLCGLSHSAFSRSEKGAEGQLTSTFMPRWSRHGDMASGLVVIRACGSGAFRSVEGREGSSGSLRAPIRGSPYLAGSKHSSYVLLLSTTARMHSLRGVVLKGVLGSSYGLWEGGRMLWSAGPDAARQWPLAILAVVGDVREETGLQDGLFWVETRGDAVHSRPCGFMHGKSAHYGLKLSGCTSADVAPFQLVRCSTSYEASNARPKW